MPNLDRWLFSNQEREEIFLSAPPPVDPDYDRVLSCLDNVGRIFQNDSTIRDLEELRPGNVLCDVYGHDSPTMNEMNHHDYEQCAEALGLRTVS